MWKKYNISGIKENKKVLKDPGRNIPCEKPVETTNIIGRMNYRTDTASEQWNTEVGYQMEDYL